MTIEERPWGSFEVLLDAPECKVKRIIVKAGKRFSLQRHKLREEHWIMVSGTGVLTTGYRLDDLDDRVVKAGDSIHIDIEQVHRIKAGGSDLTFIEVQLGASFEESDIERFEDDYGRSN